MIINKIIGYLKKNVSSARFKHILGTCETAKKLAEKHKISKDKAELAALLHDAGKGLSKPEMIKYIEDYKVSVPIKDLTIKYNPSLLHGYISADIAKRIFKIKNKEILDAICLHTVGGEKMSDLAKIIYLADATSPDRRYSTVKKIRYQSMRNIDKAVQMAMANKLHHVILKNKWLHPHAIKAWNSTVK